jgi:hypothetical protein
MMGVLFGLCHPLAPEQHLQLAKPQEGGSRSSRPHRAPRRQTLPPLTSTANLTDGQTEATPPSLARARRIESEEAFEGLLLWDRLDSLAKFLKGPALKRAMPDQDFPA